MTSISRGSIVDFEYAFFLRTFQNKNVFATGCGREVDLPFLMQRLTPKQEVGKKRYDHGNNNKVPEVLRWIRVFWFREHLDL